MTVVRKLPPDVVLEYWAREVTPGLWRGGFTVHSHAGIAPKLLNDATLPQEFKSEESAKFAADHAGRDWINAEYPVPDGSQGD